MPTIYQPDAIIIGSGAGGGSAAHLLTKRGMNVVVLEKGKSVRPDDFLPYDELHFHSHKSLIPHVNNDPNIYVGPDGQPRAVERWWNANMVGGTTMIWDANMPRYTREDMEVRSFLPEQVLDDPETDMVNWDWSYDEFQPYFEQAERDWGISGLVDQCPSQEPARQGYQYPMPPLKPHASNDFLFDAFGKVGMKPYLGPRAINSRTNDGRPACSFCGYNQYFGCAVNSRANSSNTVLAKALATGKCDLRTEHCATRLVHEGGRIKGVMYKTSPDGTEYFIGAPLVFVSIQPIESARLFLISEIPDPNDLIGHYLTYHPRGSAELTFKKFPVWDKGEAYQPRTAVGSLQLRDLYVVNDDKRKDIRKCGKFSVYDAFTTIPPIRLIKGASFGTGERNLWGKRLKERLAEWRNQGGVYFSFTGDTVSMHGNRVELDPDFKDPWGLPSARVFFTHHDYDIEISKYALNRVAEIMTDAGGEVRTLEPQSKENTGTGHVQGSLRAGKHRDKTVLDQNCQSWDVKGLYVVDASFMPTAGASNPSMTLIANAYRVCQQSEFGK